MTKVLGVVILHFPNADAMDCINTYLPDVDWLLVIDNSDPASAVALPDSPKLTLITNHGNKGVAHALNQAAHYARSGGFDWMLMMDQDSAFAVGSAGKLIASALNFNEDVAIVSAAHSRRGSEKATREQVEKVRITMTSGSLLNLKAWSHCGPFDESLFIDSVDHEYCLRLRKSGWRVLRLNSSILFHYPGKLVTHRFGRITFQTIEHPASRHYFMTRNRLAVMKRYVWFDAVYCFNEIIQQAKAIGKVVLLEREKASKLRFTFQGISHFFAGKFPHHA